jgi:hypothetical protein
MQRLISRNVSAPEEAALPYKVIMSLLDKEDIGSIVIEDLLITIFQSLHKHKDHPKFSETVPPLFSFLCLLRPFFCRL